MTAGPAGHGVRRMCVAFDLERYSTGTDAAQIEKQRAMRGLVREAGERGSLERAQWIRQEQGDGELALLPPGIDEARVISALWREFREGLHRYNRHANAATRIRMRVAIHEGMTYVAESGFAGTAIDTVCRLRDCREAKDALSGIAGDLMLIVSDRIFHDVISGFDMFDLPASGFTETAIDMPDKDFRATAYIFTGDGLRPDAPPDDAASPKTRGPGDDGPAPAEQNARGGGRSDTSVTFSGPHTTVEGDVAGTINNWHG
jgi:hypothetical protein